MRPSDRKPIAWPTPKGRVLLLPFCTPEEITAFSFNPILTKYPRFRPLISKKETLLDLAARPDANVALALGDENIIGFAILTYPQAGERWERVGDRVMMEVAALEVMRPWRGMGIARALLRLIAEDPSTATHILYMVAYSWTWDLQGNRISASDYRNLMVKLGTAAGFKIFQTNEPNILLRPENLFMARIGADVSAEIREKFKWVRFNLA